MLCAHSNSRWQRCPAGRGLWDPPCCGACEPGFHRHKEASIYWWSSRWVSNSSSCCKFPFLQPHLSSSIFPILRSVPPRQRCHQEALRGLHEERDHQPEPGKPQQGSSGQWSCQHWKLSSSITSWSITISNGGDQILRIFVLNIPVPSKNISFCVHLVNAYLCLLYCFVLYHTKNDQNIQMNVILCELNISCIILWVLFRMETSFSQTLQCMKYIHILFYPSGESLSVVFMTGFLLQTPYENTTVLYCCFC